MHYINNLKYKSKEIGMKIKKKIERIISNIPFEIRYILILFITTRVLLTVIGYYSHIFINGNNLYRPSPNDYSPINILQIWGVWDSGWYTSIATNGYSTLIIDGKSNIAFFPFYPLLMKLLGIIIGNYYNAGIIISNVCLVISCIYLYKLVMLESDKDIALNSIKYLMLFPTAFILSGVFSESLYLALMIMCFYYARKEKWIYVGILGFFLAMTRYIGVLIVLPLIYIYLEHKIFKIYKIKIDILYFILIPIGLIVFMLYDYYLTGDFIAFYHMSKSGWGNELINPLELLYTSINSGNISVIFQAAFTIICFLILIIFYKMINFPYWLVGMYTIVIPLCSGVQAMFCMSRYILTIFPLFIIFAKLGKDKYIDQYLVIICVLLQTFLMIFWTNQYTIVV